MVQRWLIAWALVTACECLSVSPEVPAPPPSRRIGRSHAGAQGVCGALPRLRGGAPSSSLKFYRVLGIDAPSLFVPACAGCEESLAIIATGFCRIFFCMPPISSPA